MSRRLYYLEQLKSLSLEIHEALSKNVAITENKEKQYVRQVIYKNQVHLPTKFTLIINFAYEPVTQCDFPVVENTLLGDCKVNDINYK